MTTDPDGIEAVARAAVLAGGAELRDRYRDGDDDGDYGAHDVKAAADEAAEARMLPLVRRAFPAHEVFAEEAGEFDGTEPYRWIIDPLDGTNNFAAGLPTFGSSVAVRREGDPLLAAVHLPATDETYLARRNAGVRYDGERVTADSDVPIEGATVATIVGRDVPRSPDLGRRADEIREALDDTVKRVLDSWAPTVHSSLFARGRIEGLVQFHPDEEEQAVTELLAAEAGGATRRDGPLYVAGCDEETLAALWAAVDRAR
ncbi:myo-inositol-1(or 4)-monophosphatase [Halobiforma haloterrestris]|uniref:fructose-bisphosphatase n=1 Tax=Natronobacterium haloterrestre TaxID=148448 RepID=A0A1I1LD37_NATHA|nr:inositol monophosphatase family protein [Halobiforma haloterrestris]SFC70432.1 myo-inositol-1(or 4)-monophosphatase [Halobiforma haloterrestris]